MSGCSFSITMEQLVYNHDLISSLGGYNPMAKGEYSSHARGIQ